MPNGVRFIRKGGHVIPIRINPQQGDTRAKEGAKAAGLVAGGLAAGAAAGTISAHIHREAAYTAAVVHNVKKVARNEVKLGMAAQAKRTRRFAAKSVLEMRRFHASGKIVQQVGATAGAALIGAGVHKALDQTPLKDDPKTKAAIAAGAGLGANFAIRSAYLKTMGGKGIKGFDVLKLAAKRIAARGFKL